MYPHLDLCSGIGGFAVGLEATGKFQTKAFAEIDPYCQKVLAHHWPGRYQFGDVANVTTESMERVGLDSIHTLTAGFPCTPFSTAGAQKGASDPRYLWPQVERIIRAVRPRYIVLENVPGLLSNSGGRVFGRILGDLAQSGYDAEWEVLPASAFGAWHRRDRVWIIAYPNRLRQHEPPTISQSGHDLERYVTSSGGERRTEFHAVGASAEVAPDPSSQRLQTADYLRQRGSGVAWHSPRIFRFAPMPTGFWDDGYSFPYLVYGLSGRTPEFREWQDGVKALGNSIVPQIAQWIAERIIEDSERNGS